MKLLIKGLGVVFIGLAVAACSPKVGSDEWCAAMKEKPKGDWTANELGDFSKHCIFK